MSLNINLQQYWAYYMRDDDSLSIENIGDADVEISFKFGKDDAYYGGNLYYRKYLDWYSIKGTSVVIKPGEIIRFRGSLKKKSTALEGGFSMSGNSYVRLSGKLMSISKGMSDDKKYLKITNNSITGYTFQNLFAECTPLKNVNNLILADNTEIGCYSYMFSGCTSLTGTPLFKNIQLCDDCYSYMFSGCTSLTYAGIYSYDGQELYYELPSTELAPGCYSHMFDGCSSLVNIPRLPALELKSYCYDSMFLGCKAAMEAPALPAENLAMGCYSSMFAGCENLWYAPELHAKILVPECYNGMFNGCKQLKKIVLLAEDIDRDAFGGFVDSKVIDGITRYMYHFSIYRSIFGAFVGQIKLPYYNENNDWYTLVIPYNFKVCKLYNLDKRYNSDPYGWIGASGLTSKAHYPEFEEIVTYLVPTFAEWYAEVVDKRNIDVTGEGMYGDTVLNNDVRNLNSMYGRSFGTTPTWATKWPTLNLMPGGLWRVIDNTGYELRDRYKKDEKQI